MCQGARHTFLGLLSALLLIMDCHGIVKFSFDALLCSDLGDENPGAGHIEWSRGSQVPSSCTKCSLKSCPHVI